MRTPKRIKIYEYPQCSTCKKALRYLADHGVEYDKIDISKDPPSKSELKRMLGYYEGNVSKLFNTSGVQYRELKLSERLKKMSHEEALDLLSQNGKLVKRPFLLASESGRVGFKEEEWEKLK